MRRTLVTLTVLVATVLVAVPPALAQEPSESGGRPWHYWIAPFVLAGAVLSLVALFVGYYVRVMGRGRR